VTVGYDPNLTTVAAAQPSPGPAIGRGSPSPGRRGATRMSLQEGITSLVQHTLCMILLKVTDSPVDQVRGHFPTGRRRAVPHEVAWLHRTQ
jgi:hypothetical protein